MANKVYEFVTQQIISRIEEAIQNGDVLPWQKPWVYAHAPRNYVSQQEYKGINTLLLDGGQYLTWNQLCDLQKHNPDLKLRKGCHKHMVVYFNFTEQEKETTNSNGQTEVEKCKVPFLKYYNVFSAEDVDGLPLHEEEVKFEHEPHAVAQALFDDYINRENIRVTYQNGNKACYSPLTDTITLPCMEQFEQFEEFYSTAFHEATHSTGAKNRLDRHLERGFFGDAEYSKEELTAEIGASVLNAHCGLLTPATESNSVAYMRSWISVLKDNVTWLVAASSAATKATGYIIEGSQISHPAVTIS